MRILASGHQEPEMLDCAWLCLPNGNTLAGGQGYRKPGHAKTATGSVANTKV